MVDLPGSVVPETTEVSEAQFRAAMLTGLSNCASTTEGRRALAGAMDLSSKGLENILLKSATPGPKRLWDATRVCAQAQEEIASLYGFTLVRKDRGQAGSALATLPVAALLHKVAEAESPSSHGGAVKTHQELLAMETDLREVHRITAQLLHEIATIRAPRAVTA